MWPESSSRAYESVEKNNKTRSRSTSTSPVVYIFAAVSPRRRTFHPSSSYVILRKEAPRARERTLRSSFTTFHVRRHVRKRFQIPSLWCPLESSFGLTSPKRGLDLARNRKKCVDQNLKMAQCRCPLRCQERVLIRSYVLFLVSVRFLCL